MNSRRGAFLGLSLLFLAAGCGVKAQLPDLTFEPGGNAEDDSQVKPEVGSQDEVAPPDTGTPDVPATEGVGSDSKPQGKSCPETMYCAISSGCFNLGPGCWNGCADGDGWDSGPTAKLKVCLEKCTTGISPEDLDKCLQGSCRDEMLECFNETPGNRTCGDVLLCGTELACDKDGMTPAESYNCFVDCFGGLQEGELVEVNEVLEKCFVGGLGEMAPSLDCMAAMFECYGGSGDKSCDAASNCLESCYIDIVCRPEPNECPERDKCTVGCVYGMSEDAAEMLYDASLCSFDQSANPFQCLEDDVACHLGYIKGQAACKAVMGSLRELYLLPCFPPDVVPVAQMTKLLDKIKKEHADALMEVLDCLAGKYPKYPGCGAIPDAEWNKCLQECP
jgi:hypothetical protein